MLRTVRSPAPLPGALVALALLAYAATRVAPTSLVAAPAIPLASAPAPATDTGHRLADAVRLQAARVSGEARASAEAVLHANARHVDAIASTGEARVAARLAAEFGARPAALRAERARLHLSWGELAIAHTLAANAHPALPVAALAQARGAGCDWSALAAALALDLGGCVNAVREEARVATGLTPPDGRIARIASDSWTAAALPPEQPINATP